MPPFKLRNVSGRIDVKMLITTGAEGVIAQTPATLRHLLWALSLPAQHPPRLPGPAGPGHQKCLGITSPGAALATD